MRADRQSAGPSSITPGLPRTDFAHPKSHLSARDVAPNHSSQDRASGAPMPSPHRCHSKRKRKEQEKPLIPANSSFASLRKEGDAPPVFGRDDRRGRQTRQYHNTYYSAMIETKANWVKAGTPLLNIRRTCFRTNATCRRHRSLFLLVLRIRYTERKLSLLQSPTLQERMPPAWHPLTYCDVQ